MTDRREILDRLFSQAEQYMAKLIEDKGAFSNLEILRFVAQRQQQAYIDLLYSFRDTENRSPFNAAHQEIGARTAALAKRVGYARAKDLDHHKGQDIFGGETEEHFYRSP